MIEVLNVSNFLNRQIHYITIEEMILYLNEMINLYDSLIKNGHATFKNGEIYYIGYGICGNLERCVHVKNNIDIFPNSYNYAISKWMEIHNITDIAYWLEGKDEYLKTKNRMTNPKRLEAMIFIRNELEVELELRSQHAYFVTEVLK